MKKLLLNALITLLETTEKTPAPKRMKKQGTIPVFVMGEFVKFV